MRGLLKTTLMQIFRESPEILLNALAEAEEKKTISESQIRASRHLAKIFKRHAKAEELSVDSRQRRAAAARKTRMVEVNKQYGQEPRRVRRGIAFMLAHKDRLRKVTA